MPVTRDASPAAAPTPDDIVDMDAVVVSGVLPGPRMWRVSKGDNDLYILGTLSPLPKRMEWMSREVEDTIARSQAVIAPPSVAVHSDVGRSEEHTSELQSLMRNSYAVFFFTKKNTSQLPLS